MGSRVIAGCLAALLIVACSNPKDVIIPTDLSRWDSEVRPVADRLSRDDRELLVTYLARTKQASTLNAQPVPAGVTVGRAIEEERAHQRAQNAQQGEERAQGLRRDQERREIERQVGTILAFTLVGKDIAPADLSGGGRTEQATLKFNIRNVGDQTIESIAGTIRLADSFSGDLTTISFNYPTPIPVGTSIQWESSVVLSLFETRSLRLRNADMSHLSVRLTPSLVLLADGTRLESSTGS